MKPLYELDVKKFKENYDAGELSMLEYLKDYISDDLKDLYNNILQYNEIFCNGWTINDLFKMGKTDKYWKERATSFIEKYHIAKEDYDNHTKFFDQYIELRDKLLDELGLTEYLDMDVKDLSEYGYIDSDQITKLNEIDENKSFTVARVISFGNCVELHYCSGEATIEYGYKISHDYWESEVEKIDWFDKNMSEDKLMEKLFSLYNEYFGIGKEEIEQEMEVEK